MNIQKLVVFALTFLIAACTTLPEHEKLRKAKSQYEAQIRTAAFVQSFLNIPQTTIQNYVWWSTEDKVKERNLNVSACLHNARLYNDWALKFSNLNKSWLPSRLDEQLCFPVCDGDSLIDKTCYWDTVKK